MIGVNITGSQASVVRKFDTSLEKGTAVKRPRSPSPEPKNHSSTLCKSLKKYSIKQEPSSDASVKDNDSFYSLPNELKLKIAAYLPLCAVNELAKTCKTFNELLDLKEKLKILSEQYYGPGSERYQSYKKAVKNIDIAPIQGLSPDDALLTLAYRRFESNQYLASLEKNKQSERTCTATLTGHENWVETVTALPNGRLVSGSVDKNLKVWDVNKPKGQQCIATLTGHTKEVWTVTALSDGRVVSGSGDKTLKVWDLSEDEGKECIATLTGHKYTVWTVTALPDGRVVSGADDKTLKVWDLNKPKGDECIAQ